MLEGLFKNTSMKYIKKILFFTFITYSLNSLAQKPSSIFAEGKEYVYQVAFIKANSDTLTNEKLIMLGKNQQWKFQKTQSEIEFHYFPDTVSLKNYTDPRAAYEKRKTKNLKKKAKGKRGWNNYTWINYKEVTGKFITDSFIWIHPPRSNQYAYHQMNAFPEIQYNELKVGGNWNSNLFTGRGFPNNKEFVGTRKDTFEVKEKINVDFKDTTLEDCWRIEITSIHSSKGETTAEYIFSKTHGFLKMDYLFYDGVRINYVLVDIIINEKLKE